MEFILSGLDERYFFLVFYEPEERPEWKLDIAFWLGEGIHPEPVHEAIVQHLTPEARLMILRTLTEIRYTEGSRCDKLRA